MHAIFFVFIYKKCNLMKKTIISKFERKKDEKVVNDKNKNKKNINYKKYL